MTPQLKQRLDTVMAEARAILDHHLTGERSIASSHEAYAILLQRLESFWECAKQNNDEDGYRHLMELCVRSIQVMAEHYEFELPPEQVQ